MICDFEARSWRGTVVGMVQRAVLATRLSVERALAARLRAGELQRGDLLLLGVSGGADSLALAAATAYAGRKLGLRVSSVTVNHGLQDGAATVSETARKQCVAFGIADARVREVRVAARGEGPEGDARAARYAAFGELADELGARAVLLAHTRSDQAEQVLLGLARGSGLRAVAGIPPCRMLGGTASEVLLLRPFLGGEPAVTREVCEKALTELGVTWWRDPHNSDPRYARVRVRERVLPALRAELGGGVAENLARTADLAREESAALQWVADAFLAVHSASAPAGTGGCVQLPIAELEPLPAALLGRIIRTMISREFGTQLTMEHTNTVAALVREWHGQGPIFVPGARVWRQDGALLFARQTVSPRQEFSA